MKGSPQNLDSRNCTIITEEWSDVPVFTLFPPNRTTKYLFGTLLPRVHRRDAKVKVGEHFDAFNSTWAKFYASVESPDRVYGETVRLRAAQLAAELLHRIISVECECGDIFLQGSCIRISEAVEVFSRISLPECRLDNLPDLLFYNKVWHSLFASRDAPVKGGYCFPYPNDYLTRAAKSRKRVKRK